MSIRDMGKFIIKTLNDDWCFMPFYTELRIREFVRDTVDKCERKKQKKETLIIPFADGFTFEIAKTRGKWTIGRV